MDLNRFHRPPQHTRHVYPPQPFARSDFVQDRAGLTAKERKALLRLNETATGIEVRERRVEVIDGRQIEVVQNCEVFEFIDTRGFRFLFDIRGIMDAIATNDIPYLVGHVDISLEAYLIFMEKGGVEESHVARITKKHLEKPVIYTQWPDATWALIDGVHRVVWQFRNGIHRVRCIVLTPSVWRRFLLDQATAKMWDHNGQPIKPLNARVMA